MASTSENTFTASLRRAQDLAQYITKFENYKPPRAEAMRSFARPKFRGWLGANKNIF